MRTSLTWQQLAALEGHPLQRGGHCRGVAIPPSIGAKRIIETSLFGFTIMNFRFISCDLSPHWHGKAKGPLLSPHHMGGVTLIGRGAFSLSTAAFIGKSHGRLKVPPCSHHIIMGGVWGGGFSLSTAAFMTHSPWPSCEGYALEYPYPTSSWA